MDDFDKAAVYGHILGYYERMEVPTLYKISQSLGHAGLLSGGRTS